MKFLILISHNEKTRAAWETMSPEGRTRAVKEHVSLVEDLAESGELIVSEALADPSHTRRPGSPAAGATATDGPFPELKEYLAGFYLVDCEDMARALALAARIPESSSGAVEVRPVLETGNGTDM